MDLFVARQAILDERLKTYGYELLFRSGYHHSFDGTEGSAATMRVITNTFLSMGAQSILGGRRGFINFPRSLLLDGCWRILPRKSVVIEILETVEPDGAIVDVCRKMTAEGYRFALDDYVPTQAPNPLFELADYVKFDLRQTSAEECRHAVRQLTACGKRSVAEKVETRDQFEAARAAGFRLFQGYFFTRPVVITGRDVPGSRINYLRILQELQRSELRLEQLEGLVRRELSLAHKLLRYVNSAAFGWRSPIKTVHQAMAALGELHLRRWLMLALLPGLAHDSPSALVTASLVRARFCESASARAGASHRQQEAFIMGLFSLLDSILNRPLEVLLEELQLPGDSRNALLGRDPDSFSSSLFALACACESADWQSVERHSQQLGIEPRETGAIFAEALSWSDQALSEPGRS